MTVLLRHKWRRPLAAVYTPSKATVPMRGEVVRGFFSGRSNTTTAIGAAALGAAAACHVAASIRKRRQQDHPHALRKLTSLWAMVGGLRMHARVSASRADASTIPVVLVHGFGISSSYFVPTAELLATQFAVYAPDLPGHGRSDTPPEPLTVPQLADALVDWMKAVGLHRASLVGNSMGCQVIVDAAARYPEIADRLVLIGPTVDPAHRSLFQQFTRFARAALYERPSLHMLVVRDFARMGPRLVSELQFVLRDRIERKLPKVAAPTLIVGGEKDPLVPHRWLHEAAQLVRAQRVALLPHCGHAVNYSAAAQLVEEITPFLRDQSLHTAPETKAPLTRPADPRQGHHE